MTEIILFQKYDNFIHQDKGYNMAKSNVPSSFNMAAYLSKYETILNDKLRKGGKYFHCLEISLTRLSFF